MAAGAEAWRLYGEDALTEASNLVDSMTDLAKELGQLLGDGVDWYGSVSYRTTLESIVAPPG